MGSVDATRRSVSTVLMSALVVMITAPDREIGLRLARALVDARLAACVNIVDPITSVYRWEGAVQEDGETLLIAKTTRERFDALRQKTVEEHPYETPEVIACEIADGSAPYLEWLGGCVAESR